MPAMTDWSSKAIAIGVFFFSNAIAKSSQRLPRRSGSGPRASVTEMNSSISINPHFCGPVRCQACCPSKRRRTVSEGETSKGCGLNFPINPRWMCKISSPEKWRNKCLPHASLLERSFPSIREAPRSKRPWGELAPTGPWSRSARKSLASR